MDNFWDFSVWGWFNVLAVLLISLLAAKALKKVVPILNASLIPTSVLGGIILLIVAGIYKLITGNVMFDEPFFGQSGTTTLEIITYHCLALGFVASTLKAGGGKMTKQRTGEINGQIGVGIGKGVFAGTNQLQQRLFNGKKHPFGHFENMPINDKNPLTIAGFYS